MSYRPSSIYSSSNTSSLTSNQSHTALQTRINAKRLELENLRQLRDLSATLASQMTSLEQKLSTLRDGTEAVAAVLGNWDGVLGVIGMVGANVQKMVEPVVTTDVEGEGGDQERVRSELPVTLVRIPVGERKEEMGD